MDSEKVTMADWEPVAWEWLANTVSALCDEEPSDLTYSADQMVDAFIAGARHRLASTEALREALEKIASGCTCARDDIDNPTVVWMQGIARKALDTEGAAN